jgi:hypothetical protein
MHRALGWFLLILIVALAASGQGLLGGLLGGGKSISLLLSLPTLLSSLTTTFEQVSGLSLTTLGVSVIPVLPGDPALLARLPEGVTIAPELPLLIRIEPPPTGGLSFSGITRIQLLAPGLLLPQSAPTRMYAAPNGGRFEDYTDDTASAYRVIGARGGFSEFLLVRDPTPFGQVITGKLDRLSQLLTDHAAAIPAPVLADLQTELAAARTHYTQGDPAAAIDDVDDFLDTVEQHSGGGEIPDVWRAARDLVNVAGQLRATARTLRFSLRELGP